MKLQDKWVKLRSDGGDKGILGIPAIVLDDSAPEGPMYLSRGNGGEPQVLIPIGMTVKVPVGISGAGFGVARSVLTKGGKLFAFMEITCGIPEPHGAFFEIIEDLGQRIGGGAEPVSSACGVLEEYRKLLRQKSAGSKRLEEIMGLASELLVLDRILDLNPGASISWSGPTPLSQDFIRKGNSAEVKATKHGQGRRVKISSLEQLQERPGGKLMLYHNILEPIAGGDISVPGYAQKVLDKSIDRDDLLGRLKKAGYEPDNPDPWEAEFSLRETGCYWVTAAFPKLIPQSLVGAKRPKGVTQIEYEIDLDHVRDQVLDPGHDEVIAHLKGLAG